MVDIEKFIDETDTDRDRVIKELMDINRNLESKTELSHDQIVEICKLKHIAKKYKLQCISDFIKDFMQLNISKKRMGRKEFIQALHNSEEENSQFGLKLDRIK